MGGQTRQAAVPGALKPRRRARTGLALLTAAAALGGCALHGPRLDRDTVTYVCDDATPIVAHYLNARPVGAERHGPAFVIIEYHDRRYGLADAISASGARYVGFNAAPPRRGLQWWTKGDTARLAALSQDDPQTARPLAECRIRDSARA